jgi:hypothetical protein
MSGGRKPQIDNSPFRDEIRALLKDKGHSEDPTYAELAETIEERYDEDLTEGQLRDYMNKEIEPDEKMPPKQAQQEIEKRRDTIDIASKRQELVEIQESRMEQTLETEEQMDGLVLEQASDMIMMYDKLLESLSGSYERLGILQSTTDIEINMNQMQAGDPFGELVEQSIEAEIEATDDDHADYKEGVLVVEDVSEDEDGGGEVDEEEFLDKDPDEITFDDLPDEER